ncbi:MAG: hypothetical protein PUD72_01075 [Oscillospiraceae bacterium]|nr:hypothetical protein [Oscillospiraceae bacterium]
MNKFKKCVAAIMFAVILVTTVGIAIPMSVLAEASSITLYVSASGSDSNDGLTPETAVASLARTSEIANQAVEKSVVINVLSDLTSIACARYYDKNVTILGGSHTITRGQDFATISDTARSWYNPAMIEIQTVNDTASLRIENLILDDAGINANGATKFTQAPVNNVSSDKIVQSAIIESTPTKEVNITLGSGTKLINYGGMSAVRVTGPATLTMESGSEISGNGSASTKNKGTFAIWCQGANVNVNQGAIIKDIVNGMAIKIDKGNLNLDGVISNVSGNVIFVREGTSVITGEIFNCKTSLNNTHVLQTGGNAKVTFTSTSNIHDNTAYYGGLYLNGNGDKVDFYGKLNNNYVTRYGAVVVANNGDETKQFTLYDGAEICNNTCAKDQGGAASVFRGKFIMNGGKMTGNKSVAGGGAVYVRKGGMFEMNGGSITNNYAAGVGGGIDVDAWSYGCLAYAKINGGEVADNFMKANVVIDANRFSATADGGVANNFGVDKTADNKENAKVGQNLFVSKNVLSNDNGIAFVVDGKTVTPSTDVYIGNAEAGSVNTLANVAASYGWSAPIASFWKNTSKAIDFDLTDVAFDSANPVYVIVADSDAAGKYVSGTEKVYKASVNGEVISSTIPMSGENGSILVFVQPTKDYGTLTLSQNASVTKDSNLTEYTVNYKNIFNISDNLLALMKAEQGAKDITFAIDLDLRFAANDNITVESPMFEKGTAEVNGSKVVVTATLKAGWENATGETVITGSAVLTQDDFMVDDYLVSTATFTETVGNNKILVPAEKASTLMKAEVTTTVPETTLPTTDIEDNTPLNPTKPSVQNTVPTTSIDVDRNAASNETNVETVTEPATTVPSVTSPAKEEIKDETPLVSDNGIQDSLGDISSEVETAGSWALVNAILAIVSIIIAVFEVLKSMSKLANKYNMIACVIAIVAAVANIIVFFLTESIPSSMIFVDKWTIVNALITVLGCGLAIVLSSQNREAKAKKY